MNCFYDCPDCKGTGSVYEQSGSINICQRCKGKGKIDWIKMCVKNNLDIFIDNIYVNPCGEVPLDPKSGCLWVDASTNEARIYDGKRWLTVSEAAFGKV